VFRWVSCVRNHAPRLTLNCIETQRKRKRKQVNVPRRLRRSRNALATVAVLTPLAFVTASQASANASILRTAQETSYNNTTFLQDQLGLPTTDTSPAIQPVTYDNFQWLLQQSGNYAFLVGDPATDANFKTEAQEVETTAEADGVSTIYWFDPNLSGGGFFTKAANATTAGAINGGINPGSVGTEVGNTYEPNLDVRDPAAIGEIPSPSSTVSGTFALNSTGVTSYANSWYNLVSQYLGDGAAEYLTGVDTENATVNDVDLGSNTQTINLGTTSSPNDVTLGGGTSYIDNPTTGAIVATGDANDYGNNADYSTELSNGAANTSGGALYDYTSGSQPGDVTDSFFFTYNKANTVQASSAAQPEKITNWINLDTESSSTNLEGDVTTALNNASANTAGGASGLSSPNQFNWWESEATFKNNEVDTTNSSGANVPLLTSANDQASDGGWKVDQITYPELVDLLKTDTTQTATILFGGTWCPNTRPVLPYVNEYAQQNNAEVFNFDTVLDGGTTGGSTTGTGNHLQIRNTVTPTTTSGPTLGEQNTPTFLYGDLVNDYLKNINTQYVTQAEAANLPSSFTGQNTSYVSYYPGGVYNSVAASQANKLQVPFLIGYQAESGGGVNRQWIINNGDSTYTEYMSDWWYTDPQPNEIGLSQIPQDASIWSTIDSELANATYATNPATVDANTAIDSDDSQYLDSSDTGIIWDYNGSSLSVTAGSVAPTHGAPPGTPSSPFGASPSDLSAALSSLAGSAELGSASAVPATYAQAKADLITALAASTPNSAEIADLETVVTAFGVAQGRKNSLNTAWGNATDPVSVIGGLAADNALDVFFGGLPGGVVSTQTVTASAINNGADVQVNVAIANQFGRTPASNVSLTLTKGGSTVASQSAAVVNNLATFTVPISAGGSYSYTVSYAGDSQIAAFTDSGTLTVTEPTTTAPATVTVTPAPTATPAAVVRSKVSRVRGAVSKLATSRTHGRYLVTLATPNGRATATGKVTIKLKKGKVSKTVRAELQDDRATFTLPKLAAGKWTVKITWAGDGNYVSASGTGAAIKVA
jgi:hypothetical protein